MTSLTTIELISGKLFDPFNPDPNLIDINSIATGLSHICRFTGQLRHFYSVAQHSVLVSERCDPGWADWGLLHDAPEALGLNDLAAPIKHDPGLIRYCELEDAVMGAVCKRFELPRIPHPSVKIADRRMVLTEKRDLRPGWTRFNEQTAEMYGREITPFTDLTIEPWPQEYARERFLKRFDDLFYLTLLGLDERNREGVTAPRTPAEREAFMADIGRPNA